jgi:predicted alpha/beta superfamily hydrolase
MFQKLVAALLLFSSTCFSQITITLVSVPENTPEHATIFISGNFNSWVSNDEKFILKKNSKGNYFIDLPINAFPYEFKFTLGSWNSSEMSTGGGDISNRILAAKRDTSVQLKIESWKSTEGAKQKVPAKSVLVLSENFPMKKLNKTRRIWVYLPQDYTQQATKSYPVLYMHDGQNLFSNTTANNGEWEVDETLMDLELKGDSGIIVVGIDNAGTDKIDDFSPWKNPIYGGGNAVAYMDFIAFELKPVIDLLYRTKPERIHTGIMGSGMGGLTTLYAALKYESTFSKFGVFSPALWFSDSIYTLPAKDFHTQSSKVYLMSGILENSTQAIETYNMRDSLLKHCFTKSEIKCEIKNDGVHSEWFWKREFAACYEWLYRKE